MSASYTADPKTYPVIIDTDPGCDDAFAIMLALAAPQCDVRLITSVAGNVPIERTTANCLIIQDFLGTQVPVARGINAPGYDEHSSVEDVHGATGLGRWAYNHMTSELLLDECALDAQARVLSESDEPVTIVAIGPLTNVARLLQERPDLQQKIARIVIMGGAIGRGNMAPYTEFNIGTDPEAASVVLSSDVPVVMVPLEVANSAILTRAEIDQLAAINPVGAAVRDLMGSPEPSHPEAQTMPMYDPTTVAYVCCPSMFEQADRHVQVELQGTYTRGATVVFGDEPLEGGMRRLANHFGPRPTRMCSGIDNQAFKQWLADTVHRWDGRVR